MTRARAVAVAATAVALARAPSVAHGEPSDRALVLTGLALAPPTYVAGVSLHESSHALAAKLVGASVDELHVFPPGVDPHAHVFRFGWTYVHGLRTRGDQVFFYIAPKLTDMILLGGFAALAFTDAWPGNRYARLALTVAATGLWIDFAKDVVLFSPHNDIVKVLDLWCLHGWREIPARAVYAGVALGLGALLVRGYTSTFEARGHVASALVVPIVTTAF